MRVTNTKSDKEWSAMYFPLAEVIVHDNQGQYLQWNDIGLVVVI